MSLSDTLGKTIRDFCRNGFTDDGDNHCAHYVCHVLEIATGYTCKMHTNGTHPGACLRVHELFTVCPAVSPYAMGKTDSGIIFVTDRSNVDLTAHTMRNVPRKHVGIFDGQHVYNYSNTTDEVVRQTPSAFLARFQQTYGGSQALFFGTFPPGVGLAAPLAAPVGSTGPQPVIGEVDVAPGKKDYFGTLPGGPKCYIGRTTKYGSYRGLAQPSAKVDGPRYAIADFVPRYETLAGMLGVIAAGESGGYFNRLNTYDRAAFTFGFFQLAAHTPRDNLILLFRHLASGNATFQALFPDLSVVNGVLHRSVGGHTVSLEKDYPRPGKPQERILADFMRYLNEDGSAVDAVELANAAKLVHLVAVDPAANAAQVNVAAEITMRKLRDVYAPWYDLDGAADLVCTAIADVHHQGRGSKAQVRAALASAATVAKKVEALCDIGAASYPERCATLKKALKEAKRDGHLGISTFDRASGVFRPSAGWPD